MDQPAGSATDRRTASDVRVSPSTTCESPALSAYEAIAPYYDELTSAYDYERWLDALERLALDHGLSGRRLLDVGCGTGKSFEPLLARGYELTACDLSPAMVARARAKAPNGARLLVADMRRLPMTLGAFDLVICLDDTINYLLSVRDLIDCFGSVRALLDPDGLFVFDVNTLLMYRSGQVQDPGQEGDGPRFRWRVDAAPDFPAGGLWSAQVEVQVGPATRTVSRHLQRHHPRRRVVRALSDAGLEVVAVRGQVRGAHLQPDADELAHNKFVYVARRGDKRLAKRRARGR
jgi:SAM-dependent methyltransferase